ncbi:hypothetical protein M2189_001698 [Bradyrhizobium japonicum]|uniref:hypothetical protein n=1 Tax=Bradyrhizobium japonicum TaxID=375 RepID=UPI0021672231|nr:hypothetical protein [Bradyrhizobium japonicum]MCS3499341.1 hypothetical protein [Bradyrhizobium japonicum]MCS3958495.1 hypothetical protein [Bradyrhizobium japonicum]MCS4000249.1 hypothetical protein [Bradyrhizobium japonicum]
MTIHRPRIDKRRQPELFAELRARADATVPGRAAGQGDRDFIDALLQVAARLSSEVTQRLDRVPQKNVRNFFDWIGVRARAARAARLVAVFRRAPTAPPLLIAARTRLSASTDDAPAIFETERDLNILPGNLQTIVAVDANADSIYQPPPGLLDPTVIAPPEIARTLKRVAAAGSDTVQVSPAIDLNSGDIVAIGAQQYRIKEVKGDLVTIEPPLAAETAPNVPLIRIASFKPFTGQTAAPGEGCGPCASAPTAGPAEATTAAPRDWQEHVLYIGDDDVLNIDATAAIQISDSALLAFDWYYWGKASDDAGPGVAPDANAQQDVSAWQPLKLKDGALTKVKGGAIEPIEVNGQKVRVLRAQKPAGGLLGVHNIKIGISKSPLDSAKSVSFEAVANVTPAPLFDFFPLGQEPHLFDSFYVGCAEAFSKTGADVKLAFTLANATLSPLASILAQAGTCKLWGVAPDGNLYELTCNLTSDPGQVEVTSWPAGIRPDEQLSSDAASGTPASTSKNITLTLRNRPGVVVEADAIYVAVTASADVWCWNSSDKTWRTLGRIDATGAAITHVALLSDVTSWRAVALCNGELFENAGRGILSRVWKAGSRPPGDATLRQIAPVLAAASMATTAAYADGIVATADDGSLWRWHGDAVQPWTKIDDQIDPDSCPLALCLNDGTTLVVALAAGGDRILAYQDGTLLDDAVIDGPSISINIGYVPSGEPFPLILLLPGQASGSQGIQFWRPDSGHKPLVRTVETGSRLFAQAPLVSLPDPTDGMSRLIIPGSDADVFVGLLSAQPIEFDRDPTELADGLLARAEPTAKFIEIKTTAGPNDLHLIAHRIDLGKTAYLFSGQVTIDRSTVQCRLFSSASSQLQGTKLSARRMDIGNDLQAQADGVVRINASICVIRSIDDTGPSLIATFKQNIPGNVNDALQYEHLNLLPDANGNEWDDADVVPVLALAGMDSQLIDRLRGKDALRAIGAQPEYQEALAVDTTIQFAVLGKAWGQRPLPQGGPPPKLKFSFEAPEFGNWRWKRYQTPAYPALSWEYWNGKSWWQLPVVDRTANLLQNEIVSFRVPDDFQPTDVIGRSNHWIRARLVGGTYGSESYKIHIDGVGKENQTQTIDRSTASINAPRVMSLVVTYENKKLVFPKYVITRDNLAWRDQSDANRSDNATVELFPTFREALDELSAKTTKADAEDDGCACDDEKAALPVERCGCEQKHVAKNSTGDQSCDNDGSIDPDEAAEASSETQKASSAPVASSMLFIGTDAPFVRGSVRILWIVEDQPKDVKLVVEALYKGKFVTVRAYDETHGLAQTGLMSLTFDQPPTQSDLFGETRLWLRLRPKDATAAWRPVIKGAFLNAVWAEAAETQTFEILGSSDGSPNQVVTLTRPPILEDSVVGGRINSLELRVREPLRDEEAAKLREEDADAVKRNPPDVLPGLLPGYWVKWRQVIDPLDEGPGDRVYCADDVSGDIRFGNAMHGKIPPRGVDNIVATTYRRAGGAAANAIADRSTLQVVAPLEGVEGVVVGLPAAGGADAASSEATLRDAPGGLWTRGRVLTARDFESTALAYAPEIVQARCLESRSRRGSTRLVIAVAGENPVPMRAMRRELQSYLLQHASPALAPLGRFSVDPPKLMPCYVRPTLIVQSPEDTGSLEEAISDRLQALLDPATGGMEIEKTAEAGASDEDTPTQMVGPGWPLGAIPTADDVTAALIDIPGIDGVRKVELFADEDFAQPFPARIGADVLVILPKHGVRPLFELEAP